MRLRLGLSFLLAAPIACFSEPPGTSTSSGGTTTSSSSSTAAGTEESGETSVSSEPSGTEGSGSTGLTGQTSIGGTTDVTTGVGSSGIADTESITEPVVLYDLYAVACDDGTWTAASQNFAASEPPCFEDMGSPEQAGAIRKPGPGNLILELPHDEAGFLQGVFVLPSNVTDEDNVRLQFEFRCAHPTMGPCSAENFQVLVYPFGESEPSSTPVDESVTNGPASMVDVELQLGGANDELVIAIISEAASPGQAIELMEPRIVLGSR